MPIVEFLGAPGSGKTSLALGLIEALEGSISLEEAVRAAVADRGRDPMSRTAARLARSSTSRMWKAAYARSPDRFAALTRFLSAHPAALETVLAAQRERVDRDLGQGLVLRWVLNLMARFQLAAEVNQEPWLVIDEGFCQRGVAVFSHGFQPDDEPLLASYLSAIPIPHVVVMVDTPIEVCRRRLDQRGWSERVKDLDAESRSRFIADAESVRRSIGDWLGKTSTRVIWVDGTIPVPDSMPPVAATLARGSD